MSPHAPVQNRGQHGIIESHHRRYPQVRFPINKRVECPDGYSVSIQASVNKYAVPGHTYGTWLSVELGFPSSHDPLLEPYKETLGNNEPQEDSVFPYVPVSVVEALLLKHGFSLSPQAG
jgi:hypothetical protein